MAEAPANLLDVAKSIRLAREYALWSCTRQMLQRLSRGVMQFPRREHRNMDIKDKIIFGRWLMRMQHTERQHLDEHYPLFPRQPLTTNNDSRAALENLLLMGLDMTEQDAKRLAGDQLDMMAKFLHDNRQDAEAEPPHLRFEEDETDGGRIVAGEFRTRRCWRISYLVGKFGLVSTALTTMRHDFMGLYRGGQSGMSVTSLNALYDIGRARYEGFASPTNCRLLGRDGVRFCSLFDDTDAEFGSLGSFFRIRLADHPGGWILNPPFDPVVLNATASRVVNFLNERDAALGDFWFFVTFPTWEDLECWGILETCQWKVARIDFEKQSYVQQDGLGCCYRADVALSVFVVGDLPEGVDLVQLRNRMSEPSESVVKRDWMAACGIQSA